MPAEKAHMTPDSTPIQSQLTTWLLRRTAMAGVRRVASLSAAIACEVGNVRQENQDRAVIARGSDAKGRSYAVVAVADGIGGMRDGANCAAIAIATFLAEVDRQAQQGVDHAAHWIRSAVDAANRAVFTKYRGDGGSTLVALLLSPGQSTVWLSVGDSRVYHASGLNLRQVSVDDTIAGALGKGADAASEQTTLIQFIGIGEDLEPHIGELDGQPGDAAVLTTDGVHFLASWPECMGHIIGNAPEPGICVKRLVDLANWCGGPDNATAAMIALPGTPSSGDRPPYRCLEVWDAFGELQIVGSEPVRYRVNDRDESPTPKVSTATSSVRRDAEVAPDEDPNPARSRGKTTKTRRSRSGRKAKDSAAVKDQSAAESPDSEVPQLHMEFPTKAS